MRKTLKGTFPTAAFLLSTIAGLGLFPAGCRHPDLGELPEPIRSAAFAPRPPLFLTAPVSLLLTNTPGFSARVMLRKGADATESVSGELLGAGSKLVFAPDKDQPLDKHSPPPGFSFLWNVAENRGWLLSEALQGYAPISSSLAVTNIAIQPGQSGSQNLGGHPCQAETDSFSLSNGSTSTLQVLRAVDLGGFPVQISAAGDSAPVVISLSRVRREMPAASLFNVPDGFTKYSSAEAMVDELAARQRTLKRPRY